MNNVYGYSCIFVLILLTNQICDSRVIVGLTIVSYSNPNGTAYVDSLSSNRKCCDGPKRAHCNVGDTCDTFFDICVGSISSDGKLGCNGAYFHTKPLTDTNNITNQPMMISKGDNWPPGTSVFVFINDDDPRSATPYDHIDTLIQEVKFTPSPAQIPSRPQEFQWNGKTSLTLALTARCDVGYYGDDCSKYCQGLAPMAWCSSTGKLTCSSTDEVLVEFRGNTTTADFPELNLGAHQFVKEQVCVDTNTSKVLYPQLDPISNTLAFTAYCGSKEVTAFQLESILNQKSDVVMNSYFPPGIQRGEDASIKGYGEHIVPNVYVAIEILSADHPTGTSYNGESTSGTRRCCDIPSTKGCQTAKDTCDLQFFFCIGKLVNNTCVGSVSISSVFANTTSLSTCGPALLDYTQGKAYPAHPMIGAMRLTKKITEIQVFVKDSDLNGNSSDTVDILGGVVSISPGSDVTNASSEDVSLRNVVSMTVRLMFWCSPGHSGPLCTADNGTDHCFPGWHGNDCSLPTSACSPNPCLNDGTCSPFPGGGFTCQCVGGYNGSTCQHDINECLLGVCQNGATCQNLPGAFNCICPSGWDGLVCSNPVPQCSPSPCQHGACQPLIGSAGNFTCKCPPHWSGKTCSERGTCTNTSCMHGKCTTILDEFICLCNQGFKGINCSQDIDECEAKPCKNGGTCSNSFGSFSCSCPSGYKGQLCNTTTTPCGTGECGGKGNCNVASDGHTHTCSCFAGYTGPHCESRTNYCQNIHCDNGGVCVELSDGFMCNCSGPWSGRTCDIDINECSMSPCHHGGACTNTPGAYICSCTGGWTGSTCDSDVNECLETQCKYGTCSNTPGSYTCVCNEGYTGAHCTFQANFCRNVTCSGRGKCVELVNTYDCQCSSGYQGNDCELDVNECSNNVCKNNATACVNSPGSYNCTCAAGWKGHDCSVDVNECAVTSPIPCSGNGMCRNTIGGFKCTCFGGFLGATCDVIVDDCSTLICVNNGSCVTGNDGPKCACPSGWQGIRCETDVNECEVDYPCQGNGACVNTDGSYYCNCYVGWTGSKCETDVNECLAPVCQNGGSCTDLIGSYDCACTSGWQGMSCEVHLASSLTGSIIEMVFNQNITSSQTKRLISNLYQFLKKYACNSKAPTLYAEPVRLNTVRFQASCAGSVVTSALVNTGWNSVPNVTRPYLFPVALNATQTMHISFDSNSWISTKWPILAGTFAALIVIIVGLTYGLFRYRQRQKAAVSDPFVNPAYSGYEMGNHGNNHHNGFINDT